MYDRLFSQMKKMLGQLDGWFDAAVTYAKANDFEPNTLLELRLAPDQFPLARQVQLACDTAKLSAARLTGKEAPVQPDTETTLEGLRARVKGVIAFLETVQPGDLEEAGERSVTQPRWEGKTMSGADYFLEHAVPNFFFHLTHVYALLRHRGVPLGKRDYLGPLSMRAAPSSAS